MTSLKCMKILILVGTLKNDYIHENRLKETRHCIQPIGVHSSFYS